VIRAVIFDFDGVLIENSMFFQAEAFKQAFRSKGIQISEMDVLFREGAGARKLIAEVLGRKKEDSLVEELFQKKQEAFTRLSRDLKPNPKILQTIKKLKEKGLLIGLATGTTMPNLKDRLGKHFLLFDSVVDATSVKKTKPDPEPYLKSAEKLGLKPAECLVVENAPRGIQAAKSAGMHCIAIETTLPKEYLAKADWIVKDYNELEEKINQVLEEC